MKKMTAQMEKWSNTFGKEYTDRNPRNVSELNRLYLENFKITRTELNCDFLKNIDLSSKILEAGSNVGSQLLCLQEMGFSNLYGIELQRYALEMSKERTRGINIIQGSAFDIPFKDGYFDMVFTSGVLIHIHPDNIGSLMDEIYRCSNSYIWGYEYYSKESVMIPYRSEQNLMWKNDYKKLYLTRFPDLELIKEKKLKYLNGNNEDSMFLLKKGLS